MAFKHILKVQTVLPHFQIVFALIILLVMAALCQCVSVYLFTKKESVLVTRDMITAINKRHMEGQLITKQSKTLIRRISSLSAAGIRCN